MDSLKKKKNLTPNLEHSEERGLQGGVVAREKQETSVFKALSMESQKAERE